jgi:hypothetical protein
MAGRVGKKLRSPGSKCWIVNKAMFKITNIEVDCRET